MAAAERRRGGAGQRLLPYRGAAGAGGRVPFPRRGRRGAGRAGSGAPDQSAVGGAGVWRGPLLAEDMEWPHALPAVAELQQARIDSARDLAEAAVGCGRAAEAVDPLQCLAEALPYDETIHTQLIILLGHADRRAEGLRRYELIRHRLANEFGVDPGPGLRRAHLALLGDDLPVPGPPPSPVCLLPGDLPDFTGREAELERIWWRLSPAYFYSSTRARS
ncbi:hypothetical protein ETD86_10785 [Nonomuraea turkmeniaca]|uniref:Bacterial transcriptional activator domain-containing protein n=1 Tax=Nonomuraea turkmeniaca TaxID=103838 RepID=A0A5S4FPI3_9ACTN|nr:BTAD domain-containing putative transcriptional regulator [Nonomuraea turkmeniaca]TMR22615.1 hypothetical protein ETD86_10785 [Nonomuraea turkmeniaca]